MSGTDVRTLVGETRLYVHPRNLCECGHDILQVRNVTSFPTKVRVVNLVPLAVPEWYLQMGYV